MSEQVFHMVILFLEVFMAAVIGIICFFFFKRDLRGDAKKIYNEVKKKNREKVKKDPEKLSAYDSMNEKMLAQGIKYRLGDNFTPFDYTVFRMAICLGLGLLALLLGPGYVIIGVLLGFFGVPYYFKHEDEHDNGEMLSDMGQVYGIVALQLKNGVYLSDVIYDCFLSTQQPRLKKALLELSIDIENFATVGEAAVRFRQKFNDNKYIDTFAKTLEQADETGNAVQIFEDVAENLNSINKAITRRLEHKAEMKGFLFQTLIFVGLILFIVFIIMLMFSDMGSLI